MYATNGTRPLASHDRPPGRIVCAAFVALPGAGIPAHAAADTVRRIARSTGELMTAHRDYRRRDGRRFRGGLVNDFGTAATAGIGELVGCRDLTERPSC
jgi:hypothetical protein